MILARPITPLNPEGSCCAIYSFIKHLERKMQMVKVGDKVRALVNETDLRSGFEYEVTDKFTDYIYVEDDNGDEHLLYLDEYEAVAAAGSNGNVEHGNRFKVGDRVRVVRRGDDDGGSFHSAKIGDEFTVTKIYDEPETEIHTAIWYFYPHEIELVDAPLTIRAGKFYRTRDGRKVGPMEDSGRGWLEDDRGYSYYPNGKRLGDVYGDEIIAEWVDAPVAGGSNSNDTTDDWYFGKTAGYTVPLCAMEDDAPKFKVGDRVEYDDGPTNGVGDIIEVLNESEFDYMVRVESKDARYAYYPDGIGRKFAAANLRLVAPATSGKDSEPDAKLLVTISADTSAIDAEIDRVLKKLKKIKKRARKLGIDLEYSELRDAA